MSYVEITKEINVENVMDAAMVNLKNKQLLDPKYRIEMSGITTHENEDFELRNVLKLEVLNTQTGLHETLIYDLARDLNVCPKTIYNYFDYRFAGKKLELGDAIRVVKNKDEDPADHFAYNAVIVAANRLQISFVMVPSKGPMIRRLTARQCFTKNINIYKYTEPDNGGYVDNFKDDRIGSIINQ